MNRSKLERKNRRLKKQQRQLIKITKKEIMKNTSKTIQGVFKRGDYSFAESLIQTSNRIGSLHGRPSIEIPHLRELIEITSKIRINEGIKDSKPVYFKGDIIITDPCYVYKDVDLSKVKHICRDTMYGDWGCTTFNSDTKEPIGEFCADAGMVAVLSLDDILKIKPDFDGHKAKHAFTTIENFKGYVQFIVEEERFEYEGKMMSDYNVKVRGKGNINFITSQTSL